jgi:hypothetical protein
MFENALQLAARLSELIATTLIPFDFRLRVFHDFRFSVKIIAINVNSNSYRFLRYGKYSNII